MALPTKPDLFGCDGRGLAMPTPYEIKFNFSRVELLFPSDNNRCPITDKQKKFNSLLVRIQIAQQ